MKNTKFAKIILTAILAFTAIANASIAIPNGTPVVITGADVAHLVGKPVAAIRVLNAALRPIPFQVDEMTLDGEYILDRGDAPNTADGNGVLDVQDEIVFLFGDMSAIDTTDTANANANASANNLVRVTIGNATRAVIIVADANLPLSSARYIQYDHATHRVSTPYYYADFAPGKFHFTRAGIKLASETRYLDLTNELRVEILLRALFGLIPIRYNEDNMICHVRRYKTGPVRLIRRGDFHLNLGLGVKGSRAAVNQICYPQIVVVPVNISLPVNFRTLFSHAHVEMTPIIREEGHDFRFMVNSENIRWPINGDVAIDSLHIAMPVGKTFSLMRGNVGYGWQIFTSMNQSQLSGSGFVMRRPSSQGRGIAEAGFRLTVRDVTRGNYYITNRVLFSSGLRGEIERLGQAISMPVKIEVLN